MKRYYFFLTTTAFGLQLLLAASPYISFLRVLPDDFTPENALCFQLTFIGLSAAIFTALLGSLFALQAQSERTEFKALDDRLSGLDSRRIGDEEFYSEFRSRIELAKTRVYISYFAPFPPNDIQSTEIREYYEYVAKLPHRRKQVKFFRLLRDTQENRDWVESLVNGWKGKWNASIALLADSDSDEMPLAMSVQVVDDEYAWLVAIEAHTRAGAYRDYAIRDMNATTAVAAYYQRLLRKATLILDGGRVTEDWLRMKSSRDLDKLPGNESK